MILLTKLAFSLICSGHFSVLAETHVLEKKDKRLLSNEQQNYWKKKLIKYANDKNENGVLQRHALFALEQFRDSKLIEKVINSYTHPSDMVGERFLNFCKETDPNHEISIKYFIAALKDESINRSVAAIYGIYAINSRKSIIKFLKLLIGDEVLLRKLVDYDHEESEKFISNISQVYCKPIKDLLLKIIFRILDIYQDNSLFLIQIAKLLQEKEKDIVTILVQELWHTSKPKNYLFELDNVFINLLRIEDVEYFCGNIKRLKDARWIGYQFLDTIRNTRGEEGEKIYEEGRKYLREAYEIAEARQRNLKNRPSEEQKQYEKFKERLERATEKNDASVLKFYFNNSDIIEKFISKSELEKIKKLTIGFINTFDTKKFEIVDQEFNEKTNELTRWSEKGDIRQFGLLIICAIKLKISLRDYRQKLIDSITFFSLYIGNDIIEAIFESIGNLSSKERKQILKFMEKPFYRAISTYLELSRRFSILESLPYFKSWINDEHISLHQKKDILETIESLSPDPSYLKPVFLRCSGLVKDKANELLIVNYKNLDALKWRFEELKRRKVKSSEEGAGLIRGMPFGRDWAEVLYKKKDTALIQYFIDLIDCSYQIESEDAQYSEYAEYLRGISIKYFDNLKSKDAIEKLEQFIESHPGYNGINWLRYKTRNMRYEYLLYIGKPGTINDAIQCYNTIKSRQYLPISTPEELLDKVVYIIENDFKKWIENQGGYKEFYYPDYKKDGNNNTLKKNLCKIETDVQPLILDKLEDKLQRYDINIWREVRKNDGPVDFLVHYGFAPSFKCIIEVKLSYHSDFYNKTPEKIINSKSFKQLRDKYLIGLEADKGLLLMFRVKHKTKTPSDPQREDLKHNIRNACSIIKDKELKPIFIEAGKDEWFKK